MPKHKEWILWIRVSVSQMHYGLCWSPHIKAVRTNEYGDPKEVLEDYMKFVKSSWTKRNYKILPSNQRPKATKNCTVKEPR